MTLLEQIEKAAAQLDAAGVAFGHGTSNAFDEAAWLVLWQLGLPLDSDLHSDEVSKMSLAPVNIEKIALLFEERIATRKPAAYLTQEAWLQGVAFYVDERAIVPRSFIAELLVNGALDAWLHPATHKVLDLCTGNGSLGILAAMIFPEVEVAASDLSTEALAVATINLEKHGLSGRINLFCADGLDAERLEGPKLAACGPFDLILCNPPYVNARSMAALPPEYRAEPVLALDGNLQGGTDGMDFIRKLLRDAPAHMSPMAVLVIEVGNERMNFESAFPTLEIVWLETSAGENQVLLVTRDALMQAGAETDGRRAH